MFLGGQPRPVAQGARPSVALSTPKRFDLYSDEIRYAKTCGGEASF